MPRPKMTEAEKAAAKEKRDQKKLQAPKNEEQEDGFYHLTLTVNGQKYEGEGKSPLDALTELIPPTKLTAKGVLDVHYKGMKKRMNLAPAQLTRLFWPNTRIIQAKIISMGLK